jgi:quinohemoprotein ethanol dehydrogenase
MQGHVTRALVAVGLVAMPLWAMQEAANTSPCCRPTSGEFPTHGGNLGNQRYSSLTQITQNNIQQLAPAWRLDVSAVPPATDDTGSQSSPIVVDGVIFINTPSGGVIAVDGATGAARWKWQPTGMPGGGNRRGVSVGEGKVYALAGPRVVALDQQTGREAWSVEPKGPGGEAMGNLGAIATVYHDGLIFLGSGVSGRGGLAFALRATDGSLAWSFFGNAQPGTIVTDVSGRRIDAGATWGPPMPDGRSCASVGAANPWIHGSIDPDLGLFYITFGDAKGCRGSQDGQLRPGQNLFANSLVALDLKTGAYKWHFQSVHHDLWDMDNVHAPLLADVSINGQTRRAIYYGSKSGHLMVLDRATGLPLLPVEDRPVPVDSRQAAWPTQPFPSRPFPDCVSFEALGPENIPGDPFRAVPNYNGYQPNASGQLVYTEPNYLGEDEPFMTYPPAYGATHRRGCLYDPHWDQPLLSTTTQNGGGDWSSYSFSPRLGLVYFPYGVNNVAHWRGAPANGQRAQGQYQTGGIVAIDAAANTVRWRNHLGLDMAHGQSPVTTASDLLFVGQFDGNFLALDAATGNEIWRFQTGTAISSGAVTYMVNGEQYVATFAGGTGIPYGGSVTEGSALWAFKLGGTYRTASGSSEAPAPGPLTIRRPVSGAAVEGSEVNNTIILARVSRTSDTADDRDRVNANAMQPTHLRVPAGTTVTFLNPGRETFPNFPNQKRHCATQYFEGLFNARLEPGQRFDYTFDRAGEYFFNDCTDPRPTGKVVVYLTPQEVPGALSFTATSLDLRSSNGLFTGVMGTVVARLAIPPGHTFDGAVTLETPLSVSPIPAVSATVEAGGRTLVATFNKADLDNNLPMGDGVRLGLAARFLQGGRQTLLTSSTTVTVVK